MAKQHTVFVCQSCGTSFPKWSGQCANCGEWNTLVEEIVTPAPTAGKSKVGAPRLRRGALLNPQGREHKAVNPETLVSFSQVDLTSASKQRFSTGIGELDRVLGGGMVPGGVVLIGGEPGIGKSTLLTQVVLQALVNSKDSEEPILYVCGEESPSQITLRINRIIENEYFIFDSKTQAKSLQLALKNLVFVTTTDVDELIAVMSAEKPRFIIVDSIQTIATTDLMGAEGSVGQVREATQRLTEAAKVYNVPVFLVGHVTKEGTIAGPKVLEHIVDSVLELSGERTGELRLLRAIKNRFGATDEVGVFRVSEYGLSEVSNPSEIFLEHAQKSVPGSATVCVMEGTRPLLVEVQSLVVSSQLAMPRRVGRGIELSRIQVLAAVLQKHCYLPLGTADLFVSAAGGFSIKEPAVDLGLAVAMASSHVNKPVPAKTVFIGEIGLLGELRSVSYLEQRIKEAKRLGFTNVISRKTHGYVRDVLRKFELHTANT